MYGRFHRVQVFSQIFRLISAHFAADAVHFGENIATSNLKAMLGVNEAGYAVYFEIVVY